MIASIKCRKIIDIHLHNLGYDEGNFQHPRTSSQKEATTQNYFTFMSLRYAAGMSTVMGATHEARKRLHIYAAHFPNSEACSCQSINSILPNGEIDWETTGTFLKNHSALLTSLCFDNPYHDSYLLRLFQCIPSIRNGKRS